MSQASETPAREVKNADIVQRINEVLGRHGSSLEQGDIIYISKTFSRRIGNVLVDERLVVARLDTNQPDGWVIEIFSEEDQLGSLKAFAEDLAREFGIRLDIKPESVAPEPRVWYPNAN